MIDQGTNTIITELHDVVTQPNTLRTLIVLAIAFIVAYWGSRFAARAVVAAAQFIAVRSDNSTNHERTIQLRRIETYLSILNALLRSAIIATVVYLTWKLLARPSSAIPYALGVSALIIVTVGATIGIILRDITAGITMIIERWYHVGDYIRVEPFGDVSGVVESMNLRSTRIRSLNGEVIRVHNQHIQAVKVTPRGLRTIAVDVFVNNPKVGRTLVEKAIASMPVGTMTLVTKPEITREEQWSDHLYLLTTTGQTPPGREWLMDTYFVDSLKELDAKRRGMDALVRPPLVRFADPAAERSFRRAVRTGQASKK